MPPEAAVTPAVMLHTIRNIVFACHKQLSITAATHGYYATQHLVADCTPADMSIALRLMTAWHRAEQRIALKSDWQVIHTECLLRFD